MLGLIKPTSAFISDPLVLVRIELERPIQKRTINNEGLWDLIFDCFRYNAYPSEYVSTSIIRNNQIAECAEILATETENSYRERKVDELVQHVCFWKGNRRELDRAQWSWLHPKLNFGSKDAFKEALQIELDQFDEKINNVRFFCKRSGQYTINFKSATKLLLENEKALDIVYQIISGSPDITLDEDFILRRYGLNSNDCIDLTELVFFVANCQSLHKKAYNLLLFQHISKTIHVVIKSDEYRDFEHYQNIDINSVLTIQGRGSLDALFKYLKSPCTVMCGNDSIDIPPKIAFLNLSGIFLIPGSRVIPKDDFLLLKEIIGALESSQGLSKIPRIREPELLRFANKYQCKILRNDLEEPLRTNLKFIIGTEEPIDFIVLTEIATELPKAPLSDETYEVLRKIINKYFTIWDITTYSSKQQHNHPGYC